MDGEIPTPASRIHGCLLGGAIGDALGAGVEFSGLDEIRRRFGPAGITGYVDGRGAITDDTQMTLFTAEGVIRSQHRLSEPGITTATEVVHRAYLRWLVTQGFPAPAVPASPDGWLVTNDVLHVARAPGSTCIAALRSGTMGTVAEPINDRKGCGGVMRVAPIGLTGDLDDDAVFTSAVEAAAITHGHPTGYLASGTLALVVARLSAGDGPADAIEAAVGTLETHDGAGETLRAIEAAVDLVDTAEPSPETVERLGAGWIAEEALAISLYCALVASDVREGLVLAVNHSGDSDSTGAITGNLLGAQLGIEALPADLVDGLVEREVVAAVADDLVATFVAGGPLDPERYPPG